jgi:hypothetical protein
VIDEGEEAIEAKVSKDFPSTSHLPQPQALLKPYLRGIAFKCDICLRHEATEVVGHRETICRECLKLDPELVHGLTTERVERIRSQLDWAG